MFKLKIPGAFKWIVSTGVLIGTTLYAETSPAGEALLWLSSLIAGSGATIAIVPNKWLKPIGVFIGKQISKFGRKKLGVDKWEQIEDTIQSGSLRVALVTIFAGIMEGLNIDDTP